MKKTAVILAALILITSFENSFLCIAAGSDGAASALKADTSITAGVADETVDPETAVTVPLDTVTADSECSVTYPVQYGGRNNVLKWAGQSGKTTFTVDVPQRGAYSLKLTYMPIVEENRGIQLSLFIDGVCPYTTGGQVTFPCVYKSEERRTDNQGNDILPRSIKQEEWISTYFTNPEGTSDDPLSYHLEAGRHTITLESEMAAFYLAGITLTVPKEPIGYDEYISYWRSKGAADAADKEIIIQGEDALYYSDPSLVPSNDRSSSATVPSSPVLDKLNMISSSRVGQWLVWNVDVKESGFYRLGLRFRQNSLRGFSVTRRIKIDGEVPFKEFSAVTFPYGRNWQYADLGEPKLVYLEKGSHQIRIEVVLGDFSEIIKELSEVVKDMNSLYRKIIMITSTSPDAYRDYRLENQIDGFSDILFGMADRIDECADRLDEIAGKKGGESALLSEIADQLNSIGNYPETMASRLDRYSSNVSSLSSWIFEKEIQQLDIDYLRLSSPDREGFDPEAGAFKELWYRVRSVISSFTKDYTSVGNVYNGGNSEPLEVWISGGSDQAGAAKSIIDDLFVEQTGIPVNLRLVQVSLVTATFAGNGPDIALNVDPVTVINLTARGELTDLSGKEGYDEAVRSFYPESLVPFKHEGKCYGLPVTYTFCMMFYRTDIFGQLELTPPKTWQEFNETVAVLQSNNMQAGIGNLFTTLMLQRGIDIYNEDQTATNFQDPQAVESFRTAMKFFTQYNLPDVFDFYNRFRSGEMPLGIQDISQYNMLSAAAPEIRDLWEMVPVPGTASEDGGINNSEPGSSSAAAVMFGRVRDNKDAWTFLRWWTGAEAQARYGNNLEMTLGVAGRITPANIDAVKELPWSNKELNNIFSQWNSIKEIPTLPASYYFTRGMNNAFRNVLYNDANPREELFYQNKQINKEIARKRKELNLD